MQERDIIIIGAGPAGLSTALHLAQVAPRLTGRVLVLEKAHHPRPKLCAGGLTIDAEAILEHLGLDSSEVPHVDAAELCFYFAGQGFAVRSPKRHTLRIIRRDEFDAWLAEKTREAGIDIDEGITVKNMLADAESVTLETDSGTYRAQIVVGADGSNGVTRRCVLPEAPLHTARALEVITPVSARLTVPQEQWHAFFDFHPVPEGIAGYTWSFPTQVSGLPMLCWGIYDTNLLAHKKRPPLKTALAREMKGQGIPPEDYPVQGHPIRWFDPRNPVSAQRVLLVGDAAGADSLLGEGISQALGYGKLAAAEIARAFRTGDFTFKGYKRRLTRSSLGRALFARWVIARILYRFHWKWFQKTLWRFGKLVIIPISAFFVINWGRKLK